MSKNSLYLMNSNNRANLSHQYYSEIINTTDGEKVKIHKLMFNESKSLFLEDYGLTLLDVRKLTEEEIEQFISVEDYKSKNLTAYYSFPEIKWLLEFPIKPVEQ